MKRIALLILLGSLVGCGKGFEGAAIPNPSNSDFSVAKQSAAAPRYKILVKILESSDIGTTFVIRDGDTIDYSRNITPDVGSLRPRIQLIVLGPDVLSAANMLLEDSAGTVLYNGPCSTMATDSTSGYCWVFFPQLKFAQPQCAAADLATGGAYRPAPGNYSLKIQYKDGQSSSISVKFAGGCLPDEMIAYTAIRSPSSLQNESISPKDINSHSSTFLYYLLAFVIGIVMLFLVKKLKF